MMRALRGEIVTEATWRLTYPDRPDIIVQGSAAPVRGPDGELLGAVSSFRDVTEQAELEQQKDEFLSLVAHELRTPVTVIRGYAQLMQRRTPDERLAGPLSVMGRQVDQLVALIDELLDLSRVQTGSLEVNPVPLDYAELVQGVAEDVRVLHAGRRIELDVPPSLLVMADPIRLRQVLVNLLDNAAKYGPEESAITVQASLQGGACVTTVCDGGPALPADQREHIFTRFYRASEGNRAASGLGIGLYLARAIVEQHGGRIWLMEGDTCCFAFSIPIETAISSERA
jgi:signal transduction histidine kinase